MAICKDCKFYKRGEIEISLDFLGECQTNSDSRQELFDFRGVKACCHPNCFIEEMSYSFEYGNRITTKRIAGQYQFNKDFNCTRYKPTLCKKITDALIKFQFRFE